MLSPATYDPATCPRWPWRVVVEPGKHSRVISLPELPPCRPGAGDLLPHAYVALTGQLVLAGTYRSDGPTLWPKAWREWLWGPDCRTCDDTGDLLFFGEWWECKHRYARPPRLRRALYRALDAPARWLTRKFGAEWWLAHDALCQVGGILQTHIYSGSELVHIVANRHSRAFRAYADRQMRLLIRASPTDQGPMRFPAWAVRWLAWAAVRVHGGLKA